jgi:hypothetical protein
MLQADAQRQPVLSYNLLQPGWWTKVSLQIRRTCSSSPSPTLEQHPCLIICLQIESCCDIPANICRVDLSWEWRSRSSKGRDRNKPVLALTSGYRLFYCFRFPPMWEKSQGRLGRDTAYRNERHWHIISMPGKTEPWLMADDRKVPESISHRAKTEQPLANIKMSIRPFAEISNSLRYPSGTADDSGARCKTRFAALDEAAQ